jgi:hypothetical protein
MPIDTKDSLLIETKRATHTAVTWYDAISANEFFVRHGAAWSASDNVDHLIRAIRMVMLALRLPKFLLRVLFGVVKRPSRSYAEVCKAYEDVLATGAGAGGVYLPDQQSPADPQQAKEILLERLTKAGQSFTDAIQSWPEAALDQYQLPHPLLGKLTVRETLFFSIYHVLRHARVEGD